MVNKMTKDEYLKDPCSKLSLPYWKHLSFNKPNNITIYHENEYSNQNNYSHVERYFRLIHHLSSPLKHQESAIDIDIKNDANEIIEQINRSYLSERISVSEDDIENWIKHSTFDQSLWIKLMFDGHIVASGIAEFDSDTKEGIIEWVQVLPEYQNRGYGKIIVNELLYRLSKMADFVTVSGRLDNDSNPKRLYESCGFEGANIWYICYS